MYWMRESKRVKAPRDVKWLRPYAIAIAIVFAIYWLTGCAELEPNSIRVEGEHVSHMSQHAPFTDRPTNYGDESVEVLAHWKLFHHGYLEAGEGINVSPSHTGQDCDGGLCGPREIFIARVGYVFNIKPEAP